MTALNPHIEQIQALVSGASHVAALSGPGQLPSLIAACSALRIPHASVQLYFAYEAEGIAPLREGTLRLGTALGFAVTKSLHHVATDAVIWTHRGGAAPKYIADFAAAIPRRRAIIEMYDGQRSNFVIRQEATAVSRGQVLEGSAFAADLFVAPAFAQWDKFAYSSANERTLVIADQPWRAALKLIADAQKDSFEDFAGVDAVLGLGKFAELGYPLEKEMDFYKHAIDHLFADGASCILLKPHPRTLSPGKLDAIRRLSQTNVRLGDPLTLVEMCGFASSAGVYCGLAGTAQLSMRQLFDWRTAYFGKPLIQKEIDPEFGVTKTVPANADFWVMNELHVMAVDEWVT